MVPSMGVEISLSLALSEISIDENFLQKIFYAIPPG